MAGGSSPSPSAPLAGKLGVGPGHTVAVVSAPPGWTIDDLPAGATVARRRRPGAADVSIVFVRAAADLQRVVAMATAIGPDESLWVAWPRRAAGHRSDVTDEIVRGALLTTGLVDVKVAAIGEDWSGLRFVWRRERRSPRG